MTSALHFVDFEVEQFGNHLFPVRKRRQFVGWDMQFVDNFSINVGGGFPMILSNLFTNTANVEEQLVTHSVFCVSWTITRTFSCGNRLFRFGG